MKLLLETIQYEKYNWNICGDIKVNDLLLGYTKFCCFLCQWDSRDRKYHYIQKQRPKRESLIPGQKNVVNAPLINPEKVYLPQLHIKLGILKNVVKAMDQNGVGFMYLKNNFSRISDSKIIEGELVRPEITDLIQDVKFHDQISEVEKQACKSLKNDTTNILGYHKAENYRDIVADLLKSYKATECNVSLQAQLSLPLTVTQISTQKISEQ